MEKTSVSAIMFDMNELFEEYVARIILKTPESDVFVFVQNQKEIWNGRMCRLDIIFEKGNERIILDTKWKQVESKVDVASADIYQMFAYLHKFSENKKEAKKALLVYPCTEEKSALLDANKIQAMETRQFEIENSEKELGICWFNVFGKYF